ncbi:MAG: response regulator [Myxococcota bacterium]|nr:response regulator [Myxococcota bacterium]
MLVVDDYVDSAEIISTYIEILGHECRFAVRGYEALEIAATFRPDIVILDLDLPDLHGCEVARMLRRTTETPLQLIALTGSARPADRDRASAAGFDRFFVKPVGLAALGEILAQAGATASAAAVARGPA